MKILFVGQEYHYMMPERGRGLEYHYFLGTLKHMSDLEVSFMPYERMYDVGRDKFNEELRAMVNKEKPDVLFVVLSGEELKKETIRDISKNTKTITIAWFSDDQWRFENYSRFWAPCFDWVVTTDAKTKERYVQMGYSNTILSQWAFAPTFFSPSKKVTKKYDVTFVGQPHGKRKKFIDTLRADGFSVACWGHGWSNGMVSQKEMCEIFSESKINLNFNKSSGGFDIRGVARIFFKKNQRNNSFRLQSPVLWIPNMKSFVEQFSDQIKLRNFEIPGCGGFLLAEYVSGLEQYYGIGKEIECFSNEQELLKKVRHYLSHETEREVIAQAGYVRTLREHTFEQRFREIFGFIEKKA